MRCDRQVIRRYGLQARERPTPEVRSDPLSAVVVNGAAQNREKFGNTLSFVEDNSTVQLAQTRLWVRRERDVVGGSFQIQIRPGRQRGTNKCRLPALPRPQHRNVWETTQQSA